MPSKYMPQDVFDFGALSIAMCRYSGIDPAELTRKLVSDYERSFRDENLMEDWLKAAALTEEMLPSLFPDREMTDQQKAQLCKTLSGAVSRFDRSGKRKRKLFRGTLFTGLKQPISDKLREFKAGLIIYHMLLISGQISAKECSG